MKHQVFQDVMPCRPMNYELLEAFYTITLCNFVVPTRSVW